MSGFDSNPAGAVLPALRDDIEIMRGASTANGCPTWTIYDPVAHRYFQIDLRGHAILESWDANTTVRALRDRVFRSTGEEPSEDEIEAAVAFAENNELLISARGGWRAYARRAEANRPSVVTWLIHNYLFVKIPLVRPQAFLTRTMRYVEPLYSRRFALLVGVAAMIGLNLASRQSNTFFGTFPHFFSFSGALLYLMTLTGVKALHELGHAYTATRFKCRVPTIGVAFLVMAPMLYSDVTDSWKLRDRRQRIAIGVAGVAVELILASFAIFLWAFLPDGIARSIAFLVATTSWITSIAINLNPFMRFDGYFLLSDYLGVANLQTRAFALGRWWMRELFFDLRDERPDQLPRRLRIGLIIYAYAIWLYRLVVFFGIALLVYHYFFKVLGVILFCVEVGWFIAKPITTELRSWWSMRALILARWRRFGVFGAAGVALALFVLPWSGSIEVPVIVEPVNLARLYPSSPARIVSVVAKQGQTVVAGDIICRMRSPRIEHDLDSARIERGSIMERLGRRAAERRDRSESLRLETELALIEEKIEGLDREAELLVLRAPIDGTVIELDPDLNPGRWISRDEEVAVVAAPGAMRARGYVSQDDLARLAPGDTGHLVFEDNARATVPTRIEEIAYAGATQIDIPYLASTYGGAIATREAADHTLVSDTGVHMLTMRLPESDRLDVARGTAVIAGARYSMAAQVWLRILRVLVRESGV